MSMHQRWRAFSSSIHQLPYAKPEGTATPLSQSPFPHVHKRTPPLHLHTVPWWPSTSFCQRVSGSQQHPQGAGNALV